MVRKKHWWSEEIKTEARRLRAQGCSYSQITKALGVVKSTLNTWFRDLPRPPEFQYLTGKDWLKKIRPLALLANKRKHEKIEQELLRKAQGEAALMTIGKSLEKSVLAILYLSEGSKGKLSSLVFANTDPRLVLLFLTLLRKCYSVDESKLRVRLHLHGYHKETVVKKFWSDLLKIPQDQFGKTYRKKRGKEKTFRRNFGGICFLKYNSVYLQREITQFGFALAEKMAGRASVPVA